MFDIKYQFKERNDIYLESGWYQVKYWFKVRKDICPKMCDTTFKLNANLTLGNIFVPKWFIPSLS